MFKILQWRPRVRLKFVFLVTSAGLFYVLYIWRLGLLPASLSTDEAEAATASQSLDAISDNPLYAAHKLVQYGLSQLFNGSITSLRAASVIFAGLFMVSFYLLVINWFGKTIGLAATLLFSSLPWLIIISRNATTTVMLLSPLAVMCVYYWLARSQRRIWLPWLVFCLTATASLYVPGMVWILMAALILSRKVLWFNFKRLSALVITFGILLFATAISPLVYGLVQDHALIKQLLLIPTNLPPPDSLIKDFAWSLSALFVFAKDHFVYLLGRQPLVTAAVSVLMIFGIYAMTSSARQKLYLLSATLFFGIFMSALNNSLLWLTFSLAPVFIMATAGLRFLFLEWRSIFPKNPLARGFAYGLILSLAVVHIIYGATYALSAWPNSPETRAVYVIK